jgi:hypothetical protein
MAFLGMSHIYFLLCTVADVFKPPRGKSLISVNGSLKLAQLYLPLSLYSQQSMQLVLITAVHRLQSLWPDQGMDEISSFWSGTYIDRLSGLPRRSSSQICC